MTYRSFYKIRLSHILREGIPIVPKVSIIIPIYNMESCLEDCLTSLVNQSLKDIEIICVNDGSTDKSLEILNGFATKDKRFIIIDQENTGQGIARNNALKLVKGEYIGFMDHDDWTEPTMFETLYNTAIKFDCDLVEESFIINNEPRHYTKKQKNKLKLPVGKPFTAEYKKKYIFSPKLAVWNKLYKTDFIKSNHIEFMSTRIGEDLIFTILSRALAKRIVYIDNADYHYKIQNKYNIPKDNKPKKSINPNYTGFCDEVRNILIKHNVFSNIEDEFYCWTTERLSDKWKRLDNDNKALLVKQVQDFMPKDKLKQFKRNIRIRGLKGNIFSEYSEIIDGTKYKIFKIFGLKIMTKY